MPSGEGHHLCEDDLVALGHPTAIVEYLVRRVFRRCVAPAQPIAIFEYITKQHTLIIDPRPAMGLLEEGPRRIIYASVSQKRLACSPLAFRVVNHATMPI